MDAFSLAGGAGAEGISAIDADLLEVLEQSGEDRKTLDSVLGLFYWLGFRPDGTVRPYSGDGQVDRRIATLWTERAAPDSDSSKTAEVASKIAYVIQSSKAVP